MEEILCDIDTYPTSVTVHVLFCLPLIHELSDWDPHAINDDWNNPLCDDPDFNVSTSRTYLSALLCNHTTMLFTVQFVCVNCLCRWMLTLIRPIRMSK